MTGRRLYDLHCDTLRAEVPQRYWDSETAKFVDRLAPRAWAFLPREERRHWNALAARVTPKRKRATA